MLCRAVKGLPGGARQDAAQADTADAHVREFAHSHFRLEEQDIYGFRRHRPDDVPDGFQVRNAGCIEAVGAGLGKLDQAINDCLGFGLPDEIRLGAGD